MDYYKGTLHCYLCNQRRDNFESTYCNHDQNWAVKKEMACYKCQNKSWCCTDTRVNNKFPIALVPVSIFNFEQASVKWLSPCKIMNHESNVILACFKNILESIKLYPENNKYFSKIQNFQKFSKILEQKKNRTW